MILGSRTYLPIGIDVKDDAVYGVQFARANGSVRLHRAVSQPVNPESAGATSQLDALELMLKNGGFEGARAVSAVPSGEVDIRPMLLPKGIRADDRAAALAAIRNEAGSYLLYSAREAVLDYLPLGLQGEGDEQRHSVLLVAARREQVNRHLAMLQSAGLDCTHLDVGPCAALRAVGEESVLHALIELDRKRTVVSMARGTDLLFSRTIKQGFQRFTEELMLALGVDESEAVAMLCAYGVNHHRGRRYDLGGAADTGLVEVDAIAAIIYEACSKAFEQFAAEVKRSISYFSHHHRGLTIERSTIMGRYLPARIDHFLSDTTGVPVTLGDAFAQFNRRTDSGQAPSGRAFAVATGLALREVSR